MKKLLLLFCFVAGFYIAKAQAPQGFSYQAAVRNAVGLPYSNKSIKVQFSILDSTSNGPVVYKETHTTTTNTGGMFNVNVGMGSAITGTLAGVNWGTNAKFLQVEIDTTATGNNYTNIGVQQMMSVPYALYAGNTNSSTATNYNLNPSADSVLSLIGGKILETGTYTVPANEHWKVLNFVESANFGTVIKTINYTNAYGSGACKCYYDLPSPLKLFQFNNLIIFGNYSQNTYWQRWYSAPNCDQSLCSQTIQASYDIDYNIRKLNFPIWLEPNTTLSIFENLYLSIEKYK